MRCLHREILPLLTISALLAVSMPATAQDTHCSTKSECDLRQDYIDMKNRREAWDASVKRQEDFSAEMARLRAQARAAANNGRISRAQEIMHRRHLAAAGQDN